jgi:hypothetical protein
MRFSILFALIFAAQLAIAQSAPSEDEIIAQETSFWNYSGSGNFAELEKVMAPEYISISKKMLNRKETLKEISQEQQLCSFSPVNIKHPEISFLSPDVATITYNVIGSKTCGRQFTKFESNGTTVWVRRDGRWLMHLHTEFSVSAFTFPAPERTE